MSAWMIRAGRGGMYATEWLDKSVVGIGWDLEGANIALMPKEEIRLTCEHAYPEKTQPQISSIVGQICRFAHDVVENSTVVMYEKQTRIYHLGTVISPCMPIEDENGMTYYRKVIWQQEALRDNLSESSKNSLGSISTIFSISDEVLADLQRAASISHEEPSSIDTTNSDNAPLFDSDEDAREASNDDGVERIKDRVISLSWDDVEQLVAGLLQAMGYYARLTSKGPDGGRDIVASPDAFGLESPRIIIEVKHRKGAMSAPAIRSFIGGLRSSDRGLYVSTGGFTREAYREAERSIYPVKLLDLDEFVHLYIEYYDKTDERTRTILPLVRIWWPA